MQAVGVPCFDIFVTSIVDRFLFHELAEADFTSIQAYWLVIDLSRGFSVESLKTAAILINLSRIRREQRMRFVL